MLVYTLNYFSYNTKYKSLTYILRFFYTYYYTQNNNTIKKRTQQYIRRKNCYFFLQFFNNEVLCLIVAGTLWLRGGGGAWSAWLHGQFDTPANEGTTRKSLSQTSRIIAAAATTSRHAHVCLHQNLVHTNKLLIHNFFNNKNLRLCGLIL